MATALADHGSEPVPEMRPRTAASSLEIWGWFPKHLKVGEDRHDSRSGVFYSSRARPQSAAKCAG